MHSGMFFALKRRQRHLTSHGTGPEQLSCARQIAGFRQVGQLAGNLKFLEELGLFEALRGFRGGIECRRPSSFGSNGGENPGDQCVAKRNSTIEHMHENDTVAFGGC
jgi:hypothetical protein